MTTAVEPTVRERPILFSGAMVRAILEGRKTQTRRVVRRTVRDEGVSGIATPGRGYTPDLIQREYPCPYGNAGDRLWVRETWQTLDLDYDRETGYCDGWEACDPELVKRYRESRDRDHYWGKVPYTVAYAADDGWESHREDRGFGWRPSIFMPRWASRGLLEITAVRVERLQDISSSDAWAEGIRPDDVAEIAGDGENDHPDPEGATIEAFRELWNWINASRGYGWDVNPWVWVVEFKRVEPSA